MVEIHSHQGGHHGLAPGTEIALTYRPQDGGTPVRSTLALQ